MIRVKIAQQLLILISCSLLWIGNVHAISLAWQKNDFITNSFYEVALGFEHRSSALMVRKWTQPIRIYVEHQVGDVDLHNALLNAHIVDLKNITGLDIARVKRRENANILYFFTSQRKLPALVTSLSGKSSAKLLRNSVCMASVSANSKGIINRGIVYIPVDQARMHSKLVSCIVEELTQVLGLPRDSEQVYPSIFNDKTPNSMLTGLDIVLLKLLYDSKVLAGMSKGTVRPILQGIIRQWQRNGVIKQATRKARTLALCHYMDC